MLFFFSLSTRQWHAFTIPELQNFLIILEKEEAERVKAVEQKYNNYRQKLQLALERHNLCQAGGTVTPQSPSD